MKQETEALGESPHKASLQESLCAIQEHADYISKIISDLQDYARPLKPELAPVDLHSTIPDFLSTISAPTNIRVSQECERNLRVEADPTFLKRILTNLITNAIQAMPDGGTLQVKAFHQDGNVNLTVSDTGVGIPDK